MKSEDSGEPATSSPLVWCSIVSCVLIIERNSKVDWVYLARRWQGGLQRPLWEKTRSFPVPGRADSTWFQMVLQWWHRSHNWVHQWHCYHLCEMKGQSAEQAEGWGGKVWRTALEHQGERRRWRRQCWSRYVLVACGEIMLKANSTLQPAEAGEKCEE